MARGTWIIEPQGVSTDGARVQLGWQLRGCGVPVSGLRYALPVGHEGLFGDSGQCDAPLVASLLGAMQSGCDVTVGGRVCPELLDGIERLQAIWTRWRPGRYAPIAITVEEERSHPNHGEARGGVFAFSGGVDSAYTFYRHLTGACGRLSIEPEAAIFVHGMDIPLQEEGSYENAANGIVEGLRATGVPLLRLSTNSRYLGQVWEDSFGLQLGACFLVLQGAFKYGVQGSEEPYERLVIPWGSTPLTDPLASSKCMEIVHDGAEAGRTEKVSWLARNAGVADSLRVCWEGARKDMNCGRCEKCIRTKLNFWATGLPIPDALPGGLEPRDVRGLCWRNFTQYMYLMEIMSHAERHYESSDRLLRALRVRLGCGGGRAALRRIARRGRQMARI